MDGNSSLSGAAMKPGRTGFTCTVKLLRDSSDKPCDLLIESAEPSRAAQGDLAELVGRSLADFLPVAGEALLDRLDNPGGEIVELSSAGDAPRSMKAVPAGGRDVWKVTFGPLADGADGDARLRELNHRVLNSLAMLSSIIGIESRALSDDEGRAALERVRSRLVAVSNLYQILSAADGGTIIRSEVYLQSVADAVVASVGFGDRITIVVDAAPFELTTSQAAALGLITNEAMTNAYKHAFAGRDGGRIEVSLSHAGDELLLGVSDNGTGMPKDAHSGLGTTLVEALAVDLSGTVSVESGDWGTSVRVRFPRVT